MTELNTHETIIYEAGIMRWILDAYTLIQDEDDPESSIGRFRAMKPFMTEETAERILDIYSHFDLNTRMGITSHGSGAQTMPIVVGRDGWRRPDSRFLNICVKHGLYDLRSLYYSINDTLFQTGKRERNTDASVRRKGEFLFMKDFERPIQLFDPNIDPVVPFVELTPEDCANLRLSPAKDSIHETWQEYKRLSRLPLGRFNDDTHRLSLGTINLYPPLRGNNSIDEVIDIVTSWKLFRNLDLWFKDPNEWTEELRKRVKKGLSVPNEPRMSEATRQAEYVNELERDVVAYRHLNAERERTQAAGDNELAELQALGEDGIERKYGIEAGVMKAKRAKLQEQRNMDRKEEEYYYSF